jgi:hypothetical protein
MFYIEKVKSELSDVSGIKIFDLTKYKNTSSVFLYIYNCSNERISPFCFHSSIARMMYIITGINYIGCILQKRPRSQNQDLVSELSYILHRGTEENK